jgi:hypothetical protein
MRVLPSITVGEESSRPTRGSRSSARAAQPLGPRRPRAPRNGAKQPVPALSGPALRLQAALLALWRFLTLALQPFRLRGSARRLRVMETLSLGNKQTLSLVRVDGQDFLVGGNDSAVTLLATFDSTDQPVDLNDVQRLAASFYSKVQ